jgi:DNA replication protein DnaC
MFLRRPKWQQRRVAAFSGDGLSESLRELAEGGYITRAEPVVLIFECGTGKTHLATGLCVAACRQKRRVRFATAANLVNELVEASQHHEVRRACWHGGCATT